MNAHYLLFCSDSSLSHSPLAILPSFLPVQEVEVSCRKVVLVLALTNFTLILESIQRTWSSLILVGVVVNRKKIVLPEIPVPRGPILECVVLVWESTGSLR